MSETAPPQPQPAPRPKTYYLKAIGLGLFVLAVCYAYAFSNPEPQKVYDYQFRLATALLHGHLGLSEGYSWLNELVPFEGKFYTVFPLGSILCHIPIALVQLWRGSDEFPAREMVALVVGQIALFIAALSARYRDGMVRRALFVIWLLFGTWAWCNLAMANAWQIALALAMLGQFGALAFTLISRNPLLAGLYFAVGFGNRTEILLVAPIFFYLLVRRDPFRGLPSDADDAPFLVRARREWRALALFCVFPALLGVATLWYNWARFHSPLDFGYARIPGVLTEYWYSHGIFSWQAIPMNIKEMFWQSSWDAVNGWPFMKPNALGGSITSACPFLLCLVRPGGRDPLLRRCCWIALGVLLVPLLLHGNSGGMQFSYRYATVLLPWVWMILLDRRGGKVSFAEWTLLALSLLTNGWAVYMRYWLKQVG